jgi:hypothetical protein
MSFDPEQVALLLVRNKQVTSFVSNNNNASSNISISTSRLSGQESTLESTNTHSTSLSSITLDTPRSTAQIAEDRSIRLKSVLRAGRSFSDVAPPRKKRTQLVETKVKFKVSFFFFFFSNELLSLSAIFISKLLIL